MSGMRREDVSIATINMARNGRVPHQETVVVVASLLGRGFGRVQKRETRYCLEHRPGAELSKQAHATDVAR
jgi:hypothetical protein